MACQYASNLINVSSVGEVDVPEHFHLILTADKDYVMKLYKSCSENPTCAEDFEEADFTPRKISRKDWKLHSSGDETYLVHPGADWDCKGQNNTIKGCYVVGEPLANCCYLPHSITI